MRILLGFLIVLIGLQMFFGSVGFHNFPTIDIWWPVILIAIGFLSWRSNPRLYTWPFFMIAIGIIFLLTNLNVIPGNGWSYLWPVVLILGGAQIMFGRSGGMQSDAHQGNGRHIFAAFSGRNETVVGQFSAGQVSAWFGGVKYDLRQADLAAQSTLEIMAAFGGVEILVPSNVQVIVNVTPLFGGTDNKSHADPTSAKTITISGTALFGGVDIK